MKTCKKTDSQTIDKWTKESDSWDEKRSDVSQTNEEKQFSKEKRSDFSQKNERRRFSEERRSDFRRISDLQVNKDMW